MVACRKRDAERASRVSHIYGLDHRSAFEVEAALIDAYPGLTNIRILRHPKHLTRVAGNVASNERPSLRP